MSFFNLSSVGFIVLNKNGFVLDVNFKILELLNKEHRDLINRPFSKFIYPDDQQIFFSRFNAFFKNPTNKAIEVRLGSHNDKIVFARIEGRFIEIDTDASKSNPKQLLLNVSDITDQKRAEAALHERVKELNCLYGISHLVESGKNFLEILQGTADIVPSSWQYPQITKCRIVLDEKDIRSEGHCDEPCDKCFHAFLSQPIVVNGNISGEIRVCYAEERPEADEGPFLRDERNLINAIAERMGRIAEQEKTESALRKSEERFSLAMEASKDGIWDWNLTTGDIYCSPGLTIMIGYDSTDVIKNVHEWKDLIHPEDQQKAYQANLDCVNNLTDSFEVEYRMKTKNGGLKWILGRGKVVCRDASGRAVRMIGTHQDITERKKAEERLKAVDKKNSLLSAVVENSDNIVVIKDLNLRVLATNQAFADAAGHASIETMIGKTDGEIFGKSVDSEPIRSYMEDERKAQSLKRGEFIVKEEPVITHEGERKYVLTKKYPIFNDEDKLIATGNISVDITDRIQAETELRKSEEKFRVLFESSKDPNYISTIEGIIIDANQSFFDLFGYTKNDLYHLKTQDLYVNPKQRSKFINTIKQYGFVKDFEERLRNKTGEEMDCLVTATVRRYSDGDIEGYQGIIRDITENKRRQLEKERLIEDLQKALAEVKKLSGLLPICSHCKKIRDDKGYWTQIESYIHEHSEAEFSHGICQECAKKYYPDLDIYDE